MKEELFSFDEHNYRNCQSAFRGENNQEYYLAEYCIEDGSEINVRADKKAIGACSIIRLQSKTRLFFRRSWSHIREDATDVTVLWFVKQGSICINHQSGKSIASAGEFGITRSMVPFSIECLTDEQSKHEILHVVVPSHIFRRFFPEEIITGFCTPSKRREFSIAEKMLTEVFEDSDELSNRVEELILDSALSVLTEGVKNCGNATQERLTLSQKRRQDILRYIEIHFSDPKINADMVAQACGISRRYLSHLLRSNGTSLPNLIWEWRLNTAHAWLSSEIGNDISIAEIAFRIGFKSPAHFSRLFKKFYNISPREFRSMHLTEQQ